MKICRIAFIGHREIYNQIFVEKRIEEIQYPVDRNTHPKSAITKRNRWMMENSDLLIAYVEDGRKGDAMTALRYAERLGVKIINLAKDN